MATYPTITTPYLPTVAGKVITSVDKNGLNPIANMVINMYKIMNENFDDALTNTTSDSYKNTIIPDNFLSSEYDNKIYKAYYRNNQSPAFAVNLSDVAGITNTATEIRYGAYNEGDIIVSPFGEGSTKNINGYATPKFISNKLFYRNYDYEVKDVSQYFTDDYTTALITTTFYTGAPGNRVSTNYNAYIILKFAGFWTCAIDDSGNYLNIPHYINNEIYLFVRLDSLFSYIDNYIFNYMAMDEVTTHLFDDGVKTVITCPPNVVTAQFSSSWTINKNDVTKLLNIIGIPFTHDSTQKQNETFTDGYDPDYKYVEKGTPEPGQGNNTTSDWTGAGDNTEDSITLDSPSFSPFGDVMNQYALNALQLRQVNNYLFTADIFNDWDLLKNDPREGLVSCRYYPFELRQHDREHISAEFEEIVMGGVQMDRVSALRILSGYNQVLDLGEFDIQEYFGGFLDYQLTTIDIYLPYIGWQQLNAAYIMGRKLRIKYIVDLITGECACLLFSTDGSIDRLENVFQGVMGIDIPILTSNYNENVKQAGSSILSAGVAVGGAIATFATGGAAAPIAIGAGAATIANSAATIATMQNHQKLGTPVGSSMSLWMPQDIIFRITRPRKSEATEFKNRHGYRANFSTPLSEVSGYCQVDSPRLDIIATDREKEELKTLLQGGIYL